MSDSNNYPAPEPRPRPRWGEYSDVPPAAPSAELPPPLAPAAVPVEPPAAKPRRVGDIIITTGLLIIGVLDVVQSWALFSNLSSTVRQVYEQQSLGEFTSDGLADSVGFALNVTRAVILIVAIGVSLLLISRNQRAFWVPLAAGVLAMLVLVVLLLAVMIQDPALAEYVQQSGSPGS